MDWRERLKAGCVIPAHPLALDAARRLDERRQRALSRYYLAAGAGGLAVGVHTTQFAIRERGLLEPVLALAAEETAACGAIRVAGVCGLRAQALSEAGLAARLGYHAALLSLAALGDTPLGELVEHVRAVGGTLPVIGFYLQPAVGGRLLPYEFWREVAKLECLVGIKIAPFNRYQTLDVLRGVAESGRAAEIALYTGNDDNIVGDLVTPFEYSGQSVRFVGGLLGQWAVWTRQAVALLEEIHALPAGAPVPRSLLALGQRLTDANAALFDVANGFHGCIAGLHEILRRQGLLEGRWCLDPHEDLSPGQTEEIDRVCRAYPELQDDAFVAAHRAAWLA